jgi:carboxypeptidase family protein
MLGNYELGIHFIFRGSAIMRRIFFVLPVLLALNASQALAQGEQAGEIRGRLTSPDGLSLPGVSVTATSGALQGGRTSSADINGVYVVPGLPPGEYAVKFELSGFAPRERRIVVPLGAPVVLDQTLTLGGIQETVEVVAPSSAPSSAPAGAFNLQMDQTQLLPAGRTPMQLAELTSGLTDNTPNQNQVTIGGAMAYDNVFLVDGVDVNDNVFGQPNPLFIEEGIQELQALTSGISAEYGRFAGGVVNVVTRSGGNLFSGAFRTNLTNPSWSTRTPLEVQKGTTRADKLSPVFEAIAGGPIAKDRLWFFGGGRVERTTTANLLPVTSYAYEGKNENRRYEAKLTGTMMPGHTLQGTYIDSRTDQYMVSHPSAIDPLALTKPTTNNRLGVATWRGVLAGRAFATAQYSQKFWEVRNNGGTSIDIHDSPFLTRGTTSGVPGNVEYSAPYFDSSDPDARNNRQATASLSYLLARRGIGSHELKSGLEYFVSTRRTGNSQTSTGYIFYTDYKVDHGTPMLDASGRLIPVFTTGITRIQTWMPARGAKIDVATSSAFVTDHWTAGARLTVDAGLRFEHVSTDAERQAQPVSARTFMPRLSAAYGLTGDGRTTLSASYGVYSGTYNDVQFSRNSAAGNADRITGTYTGPSGEGLGFAPAFVPSNYSTIAGIFPTANIFFASNLKSPTTHEATLAVGRDFGKGAWARARYVRRRATDFVEDFITMANGTTTVVQNGINFGTFDNSVYRNSDIPVRQYDAIDVQSGWQPRRSLFVNGHWTVQIRNNGNFEGEAGNNPAITSVIGDYPEMYVAARDYPMGRVDEFQRHKVRLWAAWMVDFGRAGRLTLAPLYRYNSARTFSYVAAAPMSTQQLAANPGYVRPPSAQALYFGDRGAGTFAGYSLVDLASTWNVPIRRSLAPWIKIEALNVLNNQKLISWDTSITPDLKGPLDSNGLPLNYITGANFGKATSTANYPRPRPGMDGGRTYIGSFGLRF